MDTDRPRPNCAPTERRAGATRRLLHAVRAMRAMLVAAAILTTLGSDASHAQPARGDILVAGATNLLNGAIDRVDAQNNVSLFAATPGRFPHTLSAALGNADILFTDGNAPHDLLTVAPGGPITSILTVGGLVHALVPKPNGALVAFVASNGGAVLSIDRGRTTSATVASGIGTPTAGTVDLHTGDIFCGTRATPNRLLRIDAMTGAVSTVVPDLGGLPIAIASDWRSTELLVAIAGPAGRVLQVDATRATVSTWFAAPFAQDIRIDRERDAAWLLVARGTFGTLERRDAAGTVVRSTPLFRLQGHYEIERYGTRVLSVRGDAVGGTRLRIDLNAPRLPARSYYLALSTATVPDIRIPGLPPIPLRPEPLFFLTAGDELPILTRFRGMLDGNGAADAAVDLPTGFSGVRFFIGGAIVDPNAPNGIAAMLEPIGLTLR